MRKRKSFEDQIRKNRSVMTNWFKYAAWEETQKQLERSRTRMRVSAKAPDWRARMGLPARLVWLMYSKLRKAPGVSTAMSFSRSSRVSRRRRPCERDWCHLVII